MDSAQQYSLTASHRDLGEQSTGLALYFDTIVHFAILMFCMLVIVGLYPLIDAHQNSKLAKSYEVRQITANVTEAAQPGYQPFTQVCDRQGTKSSILAVSHGSRCNDKFTASYYTCPTYCDYNVTSDASTVALIAAAASAANVVGICAHLCRTIKTYKSVLLVCLRASPRVSGKEAIRRTSAMLFCFFFPATTST